MNKNSYAIAGQGGLSGYWLKMIAVVTMLIDHSAASVLYQLMVQMPEWGPVTLENYATWRSFYLACRIIGRMAFPIYCFLLVEGFHYTRSRGKYALRLFVFALLSEVPFDLALHRSFFDMSYNNVYWTLLIGLLTIWAADALSQKAVQRVQQRNEQTRQNTKYYVKQNFWKGIVRILALICGALLAELLCTDYGASGIFVIYIMYLFYEQRMVGFATSVVALGIMSSTIEFAALLMLVPMHFYNGTRGKQSKYFFYAFYPVHLLLLALLCYAMGLGI
jgi:hypothetical protein